MTDRLTIRWEEGTYVVHQDEDFVLDTEDLLTAIRFALAVSEENPFSPPVVIEGVGP